MTTNTKARTAPDDQPFDFNLDAVQAEVDLAPWRVHWNGRRWEFEHLEALDIWALVEAAEGGDVKAMTGVFMLALGPEQWPDFRKISLPQYKMKALFKAYQKHCGITPGESDASGS